MEEHFIVRLVILRIANTRSDLMREVLFRGKRITDGEWCEGNLFIDEKGEKHEILLGYTNYRIAWEVIPSTIGQYTGLTDKNGKKIFEGDIVRTQPFSDRPYSKKAKFKQHIGIVEYVIRHFKNSLYEQDYEAGWGVKIKDYGKFGCCDWSAFFKCEVIGNIHDNPELLRSDQQ